MAAKRQLLFNYSPDKVKMFNPHEKMGWNRWAYELAFYFLLRDDITDAELFDYA
jgi:hypothetical protein